MASRHSLEILLRTEGALPSAQAPEGVGGQHYLCYQLGTQTPDSTEKH